MIHTRYEIYQSLGGGATGEVFHAIDKLTEEPVALKRVHTHAPKHTQQRKRLALIHEFNTLSALQHPNVIRVQDFGFDQDDQPYFTMTYVDDAQDFIQAGQEKSFADKLQLLVQLLEGLIYLHQQQILHRDLKPPNVLVTNGHVYLLDLGLAQIDRHTGGIVGTMPYIAPELLNGKSASVASDLYAVGVLAFELFTGAKPFDTDSTTLIEDILSSKPKITDDTIPPALQQIVQRLLAKHPQKRFGSALDTLKAVANATGMHLPPETTAIRDSFLQAARFIGRKSQLQKLESQLQLTFGKPGGIAMLRGESGIGKSRLLEEVALRGKLRGFLVLRGRAKQQSSSFALWIEILRELLLYSNIAQVERDDLDNLLMTLSGLGDVAKQPTHLSERLTVALRMLITQQTTPVLLLLDDLQWEDDGIDVLQKVVELIPKYPLLVVGTFRNDEPLAHHWLDSIPDCEYVDIPRFKQIEVQMLSESILGESASSDTLTQFLEIETKGNPFFLIETLRTLSEDHGRVQEIVTTDLPETVFPNSIRKIMDRRLAYVPSSQRRLLNVFAVGGTFISSAIANQLALQLQIGDLEPLLSIASRVGIVQSRNEGLWFSHDKLRIVIQDGLSQEQIRSANEQFALAIEQLYPDHGIYARAAATYWERAGNRRKQAEYTVIAAMFAHANLNTETALIQSDEALSLIDNEQIDLLVKLRLVRCIEMLIANNVPRALEEISHLDVHRNLFTPEQLTEVNLKRWIVDYYRGQSTLEELAEIEQAAPTNTLVWVSAKVHRAGWAFNRRDLRLAQSLLDEAWPAISKIAALGKYAPYEISDLQTFALKVKAQIALKTNALDEARKIRMQLIKLFRQHNQRLPESGAHVDMAMIDMYGWHLNDAHNRLEKVRDVTEARGRSLYLYKYERMIARLSLQMGDLSRSELTIKSLLEFAKQSNSNMTLRQAHDLRAAHYLLVGDYSEAIKAANESLQYGIKFNNLIGCAETSAFLGNIYLQCDDREEARCWFEKSAEFATKANAPNKKLQAYIGLAITHLHDTSIQAAEFTRCAMEILEETPLDALHTSKFDTCHRLAYLLQQQNNELGTQLIHQAGAELTAIAASFDDKKMAANFCLNVPAHRALLEAYDLNIPIQLVQSRLTK